MGNNRGYCGWPSFSILTQRTIRTESQAAVGRWESAYPGHFGIVAREGFGAVGDGAARCSQGRGICGICGICGIWGICGSCGICGICGISGKHCPW